MTNAEVPPANAAPTAASDAAWRPLVRSFLELFALSGLAFAQPALDLLSESTALFFSRGTTGFQTVVLVVLILFVPPAVGWIIEAAFGAIFPRSRRWVHAALVAVAVAVIAVEAVKKQTSLGPVALVVVGVALGVAGGALILRFDVVRQFLLMLAFAPVVFGLLFLFYSPASEIVFDRQAKTVDVEVARPKRVVIVLFDEFPEMSLLDGNGHVDSQLFPNFGAFAHDSTWYRNETTVAPYTSQAVPAIVTGRYPKSDPNRFPGSAAYPNNLFTLLGNSYGMNVFEPVTRLCPQRVCHSPSGTGFGSLIRESATMWKTFASPHRTQSSLNVNILAEGSLVSQLDTAQQFIASLAPATKPELDYAHIELPHQPWRYLQSLQTYETPPFLTITWGSQDQALLERQQHLLQVQAADTLLGRIVAKLKAVGAYDDSLVVVTADHGIAFTGGKPSRAVTEATYPQIMWPPLFIKYPGQRGARVDDRPASSTDILPTIADVIGAKIPWRLDGSSLLGPDKPEFPRRLYQVKGTKLQPASAPTAPPGHTYLTFDGRTGFAQVLQGQAAPAGGDPALRLYRLGKYGGLVGEPAGPLIAGNATGNAAAIVGLARFDDVDPSAASMPWFYSYGYIGALTHAEWIVVAIDGTVVAVTPTLALGAPNNYFEFVVPPELVRRGKNVVSLYLARGDPNHPQLLQLPLTNAAR